MHSNFFLTILSLCDLLCLITVAFMSFNEDFFFSKKWQLTNSYTTEEYGSQLPLQSLTACSSLGKKWVLMRHFSAGQGQWCLSSPSSLHSIFHKETQWGGSFRSALVWFLFVLQPKCVVSSATEFCRLVMVSSKSQWQHHVLFWGFWGTPWRVTS